MTRLPVVSAILFGMAFLPGCTHDAFGGYAEGVAAYGSGDYARAAREFEQSARRGDGESQYMLGRLYAMGLGVPQDFVQAWVWEDRAARQGIRSANDERVTLGAIMTPGQLAQARAQAPGSATAALPPVPMTDVGAFPPADAQGRPQPVGRGPYGMPLVDGVVAGAPAPVPAPDDTTPNPAPREGAPQVIVTPHGGGVAPPAP